MVDTLEYRLYATIEPLLVRNATVCNPSPMCLEFQKEMIKVLRSFAERLLATALAKDE